IRSGEKIMSISVSVQEKKTFLEWFISKYDMKLFELNWLLEDIIADEQALDCIQFTEEIHKCPKGIEISIDENNDVQFLFFKGKIKTKDVYTAYHELHLYRNETLFFYLDFPDKQWSILYLDVIEADKSVLKEAEKYTEV